MLLLHENLIYFHHVFLWKRSEEKPIWHERVPDFNMSVTGQFRKYAMLRQFLEAVRMNREGRKNIMNHNNKWNLMNVLHVAVN